MSDVQIFSTNSTLVCENEMEYEFLILHEINLKIKEGKCQVLSV